MGKTLKPEVSVVISTYNRKDSLKRLIRSVLDQSFQDFEVLIVDDCSKYAVEKIVSDFGDPRLRYFKTEKNSGHDGKPKNIGIREAKADYITFIDDDDFYRKDALKILHTYITQGKVDFVYTDYLIDGDPGWSIDFSASRLQNMNFIAVGTQIIKRSVLLAVGGFDEDVPRFKDWNLWLRIQKAGYQFLHIPIITTEVTLSKESVSEKFKAEIGEDGSILPTFFDPTNSKIYPDNTILGKKNMLRVAVYTMTRDRLVYTQAMFRSTDELAGYHFDHFIIDQGSKDATPDWIKSQTRDHGEHYRQKLHYKLYKDNVGLSKGWNNCIEFIKAEGEYDIVIKIDNDAQMLTKDWLKAMVEIFERNNNVILSPYVEGLDGSPGGVLRQRESGISPYLQIADYVLGLVPYIGGICYATPIRLFDEWKFEESYEGNKDYLLSQYSHTLGFSLFYMEEFRVWHIDGTKGQQKKFPEYFSNITKKQITEVKLEE